MKDNAAVIGIDDGSFDLHSDKSVPVIGVVMKGPNHVDGLTQCLIDVDDADPTTKLVKMISSSGHYDQIRAVLHSGVTIGGLGVIDINRMSRELDRPVICVSRRRREMDDIVSALGNFNDSEERVKLLKQAGPYIKHPSVDIWLQIAGTDEEFAFQVVEISTSVGNLPESLRMAHMIGYAASSVVDLMVDNER